LIGIEARDHIILPKFLQHLGDASYSLYLWHVVILLTIFRSAAFIHVEMTWLPAFAAIVAIVLALASYRYLEKPLIDKLKLISARGRGLAPVTP
jgi:peptidoglycan/LPS O-acetylase OafA/YrhL